MAKSANLGLVLPGHGTNIVEGDTAGVANEVLNEEIIDTALDAAGCDATGMKRNDYTASGAISQKSGLVTLSGTGAQAMTIADPTTGTDDGKVLRIVARSAHAHTVVTVTGISGGANHKATFGGAIGDTLNLIAIDGVWHQVPSINQTLSAS